MRQANESLPIPAAKFRRYPTKPNQIMNSLMSGFINYLHQHPPGS